VSESDKKMSNNVVNDNEEKEDECGLKVKAIRKNDEV